MSISKHRYYSILCSSIPNLSYSGYNGITCIDSRLNKLNSLFVFMDEDILCSILDSINSDLVKIKTLAFIKEIKRISETFKDDADYAKRKSGWVSIYSQKYREKYGSRDWPLIKACAELYGGIEFSDQWRTAGYPMSCRIINTGCAPQRFRIKYTGKVISEANGLGYEKYSLPVMRNSKLDLELAVGSKDRCLFDDYLRENICRAKITVDPVTIAEKFPGKNLFTRLGTLYEATEGEIYVITDTTTGRKFHNFTAINREARGAIKIDGEDCCEIDYSAFHPHLALLLYPEDCEEKENYKKLLSKGFYDCVAEMVDYKLTDENRPSFKKRCMTELFYDKEEGYYKILNIFKDKFPILTDKILDGKYIKNNDLAIKMQRVESVFMYDFLFQSFYNNDLLCIPVHDSVICKKSDSDKVESIMKACFRQKFDHPPTLKNKDLTFD